MAHGDIFLMIGNVNYTAGYENATFEVNGTVYTNGTPPSGTVSSANVVEMTAYENTFSLINPVENKQAIPSDIGDMILYNRTLTDDEIGTLRTYLKHKYGL